MEVSARIADRRLSPVELTETMLSRIDAYDGALKSYQHVMAESARAEASKAESEITSGFHGGPLHGVPIAVKDLCRTHDAPTAAGMTLYKDYEAGYDCTVVARLRQAGAIVLGKSSRERKRVGITGCCSVDEPCAPGRQFSDPARQ